MATVQRSRSSAAARRVVVRKAKEASPMFVDLMAAVKSVRDHAAGKIKLKTTTVSVPAKPRRVALKKATRPPRSRKPA